MALGEAKGSERNGQDAGKRGQLCGAGVAAGAEEQFFTFLEEPS